MRIEHLYYFVKVAERRSLTVAASELFVSQQALSTAIKNLETEFHTQLLVRHRRGVTLTDEGQYFYDMALKIIDLSAELNKHFLAHETYSYASLSVVINSRAKEYFFPKVISHFYKEYPQFQITYTSLLNEDIITSVANGQAELGVLPMVAVDGQYLSALPEHLRFEPFAAASCELATSRQSPLAAYKTLSMATVIKYPLILNIEADAESDLFYQLITHYTEQANIIYTDSYSLQTQMVTDGVGNILTARLNRHTTTDMLPHIPITNNIRLTNGFLINTQNAANPLLKFFIEKARSMLPTGQF